MKIIVRYWLIIHLQGYQYNVNYGAIFADFGKV